MTDIKQRQGESPFQYKVRLCVAKINKEIDLDWSEIKEILGLDYSSDHFRKVAQGLYEYHNNLVLERESNITDNDILEQLKTEKRELQKERIKIRDEKTEYNAWLREQARMELFFERIDESVNKILSKKPRAIPSPIKNIDDNKKIVCAFADCHYGVEFDIRGFNDETLNKYSPEIFQERMWRLRDELLSFCELNDCKSVSIVDLGDSIEGILHISQLKSLRGNIVDDIMDYSEFIADWLENLSEHIYIDFYTSEGNHSDLRLLTGNKGDFPHENLEKIYSRVVQRLLKNNPNIKIHKSLNGLNYFNVNGYNFLTAHGNHEKNVKNSIKEYEDTYGIQVNYMLVGHLHCKNEIEVAKGKEVVQVRSLMGINEYSNIIKKTSDAGATMFTVHNDYGKKYVNDVKF